jgi:hypothetical protein
MLQDHSPDEEDIDPENPDGDLYQGDMDE